jgi:hypothetical protein
MPVVIGRPAADELSGLDTADLAGERSLSRVRLGATARILYERARAWAVLRFVRFPGANPARRPPL